MAQTAGGWGGTNSGGEVGGAATADVLSRMGAGDGDDDVMQGGFPHRSCMNFTMTSLDSHRKNGETACESDRNRTHSCSNCMQFFAV